MKRGNVFPAGDDLVRAIRIKQMPQHDTIYCNHSHMRAIESTIDGISVSRSSDEIRIAGMDVVVLDKRLSLPILCQRGNAFPIAKQFKEGDANVREC